MRRMLYLSLTLLVAMSHACLAAPKQQGPVMTDMSQVDADYAIQGEYVGEADMPQGFTQKVGSQVIALGDGAFSVVLYVGGLPGDGWTREKYREVIDGQRDGDTIVVTKKGVDHGHITADGMSLTNPEIDVTVDFKKISRKSPTMGAKPPAGAVVLFDGTSVEKFLEGQINEAGFLWAGVETKDRFESYTLHLEFLLPYMPKHRGQGRGNSGVYLHDCYELQVLDSFGLEGVDNECGGFYKVKVPDVNMSLPPLVWQTYDIDFTAPEYDTAGNQSSPARATVRHNGIVIHNDLQLKGTPGRQKEGPGPRQLHLQQHGNKVQYRNIWLAERK